MILIIGPLVKAHTFWLMEFIIISSLVLLIISLQHKNKCNFFKRNDIGNHIANV